MSLANLSRREVVSIKRDATVLEAAKIMEEMNVGSVVIVDDEQPLGILTDRDIIIRVISKSLDPSTTPVNEVMTSEVVFLREQMGLYEALEQMKASGIRRLPVINVKGNLSGIITMDDIISLLGKEISDIAAIIDKEGPNLPAG